MCQASLHLVFPNGKTRGSPWSQIVAARFLVERSETKRRTNFSWFY
jgi:hypothetical protein